LGDNMPFYKTDQW